MKTRSARALLLALTVTLLPALAPAQDWAKAALAKSPRHGEFVTIPAPGGRSLQAWVVYPEVKDKAPVVVLIHEIFGESDWFRLMADELAGAGYIAIAPDLLSGYGPPTAAMPMPPKTSSHTESPTPIQSVMHHCDPMACPQQAPSQPHLQLTSAYVPQQQPDHSHMQMPMAAPGSAYVPASPGGTAAFPDQGAVVKAVVSLPDAEVLSDLDAAADYGKKLVASNGKTYVAGFCWGGGKSFLYATHRKDLSAAFVFYGPPPKTELMASITAPVYGFYAQNDARISLTVPQTQADMKAAGKVYDPVIYDGAGHGFMRAGEAPDANAANTAARAEGFRRLVKLLGGMR
jgi:carboxymethylenebutenolidase